MLLLFAVLLFQGCEDTETNSPALQANIDSTFFKAYGTDGAMDQDDQSITITGLSDNQELILHTISVNEETYVLGQNASNYASFKNTDGNVISTLNEGSTGKIRITFNDKSTNQVTGDFSFTSITRWNDTISVHNGKFYAVPFQIRDMSQD